MPSFFAASARGRILATLLCFLLCATIKVPVALSAAITPIPLYPAAEQFGTALELAPRWGGHDFFFAQSGGPAWPDWPFFNESNMTPQVQICSDANCSGIVSTTNGTSGSIPDRMGGNGLSVDGLANDVNYWWRGRFPKATLPGYARPWSTPSPFILRAATSWSGDSGANVYDASALSTPIEADGMEGNDSITGSQSENTLYGYAGNDLLVGGPLRDELNGGDGHDRLLGGIGPDTLNGGNGNDKLNGGPGRDWLDGETGTNVLHGGRGSDVLYSSYKGRSASIAYGDGGNDVLDILSGNAHGGGGNDIINMSIRRGNTAFRATSGNGNDRVTVDRGFGSVYTGAGADKLVATTPKRIKLVSGKGNDKIYAETGPHVILAGPGNDVIGAYNTSTSASIDCGRGNDKVWARPGTDVAANCETIYWRQESNAEMNTIFAFLWARNPSWAS